MSERTFGVIVTVVIIVFLVALGVTCWWLNARDTHRTMWSPHCVCSQQTCFPPPDGGWRQ